MKKTDELPIILFETQENLNAWFEEHHAELKGIWMKIAKKASGITSITYAEALDCALCYGWIDGQKAAFDEQHFLQKFTPRRAKSTWSKVNREKVDRLIAEGRMRSAGLHQIELAKADGRWDAAYDSQSNSTIPEDLQLELDKKPEARAFWETLNSVNRYAIIFRIQTARKPETRAARVQKFVSMLERHEKVYP